MDGHGSGRHTSDGTGTDDGVDFALAVYRDEGIWRVAELVHSRLGDIETLAHALRRFPGDSGTLGLVAVDEDFFVAVRVSGPRVRVLISDATAADDWELAGSALDLLNLPTPHQLDDEDDEEAVPAGDLGLVADLGMSAAEMGELLDDADLYPDEMLSEVARALGFGELFDEAVGLASA